MENEKTMSPKLGSITQVICVNCTDILGRNVLQYWKDVCYCQENDHSCLLQCVEAALLDTAAAVHPANNEHGKGDISTVKMYVVAAIFSSSFRGL